MCLVIYEYPDEAGIKPLQFPVISAQSERLAADFPVIHLKFAPIKSKQGNLLKAGSP